MSTWSDTLRDELATLDINNLIEPLAEVEKDDHLVGTATDDLKKLYGLGQEYEKRTYEAAVQARFAKDRQSALKFALKGAELQERAENIKSNFWISLKDEYSLWEKSSVGIRVHWRVVYTDHRHHTQEIFKHGDGLQQIIGQYL